MFDLVTGKARHLPRHSTLPILLSTTAQAAATAVALALPAVFVAEQIPEIPTMLAFAAVPPPHPLLPPPPAPRPPAGRPAAHTQSVGPSSSAVTPVEIPESIQPEPSASFESDSPQAGPPAVDDGVPGGVEGGVPGGIAGGVVNGLPEPPPAPPSDERAPVRIGGTIQAPTLLRRIEPAYPPIAVSARLQGLVILEALVDRDGMVDDVKVLRSAGPVLDREALIAVRQWRYSPLILNGQPNRFVLTVMLLFAVESGKEKPSYAVRAK
jgi:protein TonB